MADTCPRCAGGLRLHSRFCTVIALRCDGCGRLWTQVVPVAVLDLLDALA